MNDDTAYTQRQIALDDARFIMLAHRLTYAVVQTRLREAALEEAEDQVAHQEERIATLAPLDSATVRRVAMLTAEVDRLRALTVAGELDRVFATLIPAMETIGARVRALADDLTARTRCPARRSGSASRRTRSPSACGGCRN